MRLVFINICILILVSCSTSKNLVFVKGGTFTMGSPEISDEPKDSTKTHFKKIDSYRHDILYYSDGSSYGYSYAPKGSHQLHEVEISDFYIGRTEVTQLEWSQYMPIKEYQYGSGNHYPVYNVSWPEVIIFCNTKSIAENLNPCYSIDGTFDPSTWEVNPKDWNTMRHSNWAKLNCDSTANGYRLPTEAEWEYAARGGIHHNDNYQFSGSDSIACVAWYEENSNKSTRQVKKKIPNQLGVYDMSGNVSEWCWDWYDTDYYIICDSIGTVTNPKGPRTIPIEELATDPNAPPPPPRNDNTSKVMRGGSFLRFGQCLNAARGSFSPYSGVHMIGFRIVRTKE